MNKKIPLLTLTALASLIIVLCVMLLPSMDFFAANDTLFETINGYKAIFGMSTDIVLLESSLILMIGYFLIIFVLLILIGVSIKIIFSKDMPYKRIIGAICSLFLVASGVILLFGDSFVRYSDINLTAKTSVGFMLSSILLFLSSLFLIAQIFMDSKGVKTVKNTAKGMAIGVACIVPGISGGTIAIMMGIYKRIVESVSLLFKDFRKSFLFLLPIGIGVILAILICWYPFDLFFKYAMLSIVALFAGLIIGGLPGIIDEVRGHKPTSINIVSGVVALLVAAGIGVMSIFLKTNSVVEEMFVNFDWYLYIIVIFVGMIAAMALIVPGISGSMILLVLGFYTPILNLVNNFKDGVNVIESLGVIACAGVGVVIGFFLFSKLMASLLNKHKITTYYAIIGFILGSIVSIFCNQEMIDYFKEGIDVIEWILAPLLLILGIVISYFFVIYSRRQKEKFSEIE